MYYVPHVPYLDVHPRRIETSDDLVQSTKKLDEAIQQNLLDAQSCRFLKVQIRHGEVLIMT